MPKDPETLDVHRTEGIVTVTLSRPEVKNALNRKMIAELFAVLNEVRHQESDRAVVITGAGGDFCSGADLREPLAELGHPINRMRRVGELALALHELPQPVIAQVRGYAVGAGCNLALACDCIVASQTARFSEIFVRRGLSIDFGGSWLLPRLVGLHKAKELALFGDLLTAEQADSLGLVNRVVPDDELDGVVANWASRLASGPAVALSLTKRMLNASMSVSMTQALEDEARSQVVNHATVDAHEARDAFAEKRDPIFTGKSMLY